jgi:hypothetical protein
MTHGIVMEVSRESENHGEHRNVTVNMRIDGGNASPGHPCALLLASTITPGKMKLSDYLPGHVFGECEVVEVG